MVLSNINKPGRECSTIYRKTARSLLTKVFSLRDGASALPLRLLAFASIVFSLYLAIRYCNQPIIEAHGFRQTQTALTTYWLGKDGFSLQFETPVLGRPWSIPFEFPIYQYLVSTLSSSFQLPLEPVGRLVSYGFLVACLLPSALILRRLFADSWQVRLLVFGPLLLLSPLYLFWGRTFMIETTALFFTLSFVYCTMPLLLDEQAPSWGKTALSASFLSLAFLQKGSTILPVWLIVVALLLLRRRPRQSKGLRRLLSSKVAISLFLPFLVGLAWTQYSEHIRAQNVIGKHLSSTDFAQWNFGTLAARLSSQLWIRIWAWAIAPNTGGIVGLILICLALLVLPRGRDKGFIALNLVAFFLPILIFENLHFVHDYYESANLIFLLFALATSISALAEKYPRERTLLQTGLIVLLFIDLLYFWYRGYGVLERHVFDSNTPELALANFLRNNTPRSKPIIVFGLDWSSEIPYLSQRRSLSAPNWLSRDENKDIIERPQQYVGTVPSAIVFCGVGYESLRAVVDHQQRLNRHIQISGCDINLADY